MTIDYDRFFVDGEWAQPSSTRTLIVTSASTEKIVGSVPVAQQADVDAAVAAARRAFEDPQGWSHWSYARRAASLERLADEVRQRGDELARRVTIQNGLPIAISRELEPGFPQKLLRYYADVIRTTPPRAEVRQHLFGGSTTVHQEPMGVVAAIAPFNFPQTLASLKHAPALAAGCTVVLKPSPDTVLDTYLFAEAVAAADLPPGVFNVVIGDREVGEYLVAHPDVDRVAFTGSTAAGRHIAETCGRLLRPVSLELGGKSAAIVLDDADLELADIGQDLYGATLLHGGQTCYLGTRVLAPKSRYTEVVDMLSAFASSLPVGDPLDPETLIGPMVSETHRARVEQYIAKGRGEARLVVGGGRPAGLDKGWFVEPTIFADVDNNTTLAQEEIFGPVLAVIPYTDVEDAIRIANTSGYGLAGSVWTSDPERGHAVAGKLNTGSVGINRYIPDPGAPFEGRRASGIGHEMGPGALGTYLHFKSIYH